MSRLFCFLLTVVMVAALLAGCGNPEAILDALSYATPTASETLSAGEEALETENTTEIIETEGIIADVVPAATEEAAGTTRKRLSAVLIQFPDGTQQSTKFTYDDQGNLSTSVLTSPYLEEPETTSYSFDDAGRLLSIQLHGYGWDEIGPKVEYVYDENGFLIQHTEREGGAGTYNYQNNASGRCLEKVCEMDFFSTTSQFTYSDDGLTVTETIRSSDQSTADTVVYTYDTQGRLLKEVYTGAYYSYTYLYDYSRTPFVLVSAEGESERHLYLSDPVGHPIWEVEFYTEKIVETYNNEYLASITTDSGAFYRFMFEEY